MCLSTAAKGDESRLAGIVQVHFDGWGTLWLTTDSPKLHPIGYCKQTGIQLQAPRYYDKVFVWETYLSETSSIAVPFALFTQLQKNGTSETDYNLLVNGTSESSVNGTGWRKGMKLELDDTPKMTTRVGTISEVRYS